MRPETKAANEAVTLFGETAVGCQRSVDFIAEMPIRALSILHEWLISGWAPYYSTHRRR